MLLHVLMSDDKNGKQDFDFVQAIATSFVYY